MHAVAVNAHGNLGITLGEKISVNTRLVLAQLIGAQRRIILAHEGPIRVTPAAQLRDMLAFDLPAESSSLAHGIHVCFCGITAMTARTGQALLEVNVAGELLLGHLERGVESRVALQTGVLRLRVSPTTAGSECKEQE
jgi:hypothetical protein